MPDPLRDNARLPGPRARNHQQRPLAVRNRTPLRLVQLQPPLRRRRIQIKQSSHVYSRLAEFGRESELLRNERKGEKSPNRRQSSKGPQYSLFSSKVAIGEKPFVLLLKSPVPLGAYDPERVTDFLLSR